MIGVQFFDTMIICTFLIVAICKTLSRLRIRKSEGEIETNWESGHHSKELELTMKTPVELSWSSDYANTRMHEIGARLWQLYADTSRLPNSDYFEEVILLATPLRLLGTSMSYVLGGCVQYIFVTVEHVS